MTGPYSIFYWNVFWRLTHLCPCLHCCFGWSSSESKHSPLPGSWERLFAPCKCSFVGDRDRGVEESYLDSDGFRRRKYCPGRKRQNCRLRILYINHTTGESTLHCPCATCSPYWKGVPCLTLSTLFGEDEPGASDGQSDPLIPAQDSTRVGIPCWRLGDLFGEHTTEGLELEDDPVIPAQDVGLDIFDDIPGFALAKNHLMGQDLPRRPTKQDPPLAASASVTDLNQLQQDHRRTLKGVLTSLTTVYPFSWLLSYAAVLSTGSADDSPFLSLGEAVEALGGLVLAVLLVVVHECVGVYVYVEKLPPPPRFLRRLGVLVLLVVVVVVGLRVLMGILGLV